VDVRERDRRDHRERVDLRAELAQRRQQLGRALGALGDRAVDDDHAAAAQERRRPVDVRDLQEAEGRRHGVRHILGELVPGVHDLGGAVEAEQQHAAVDLAHRDQLELDRDDRGEAPATAAQRPEELGVLVAAGAHEPAVGGDDLGGEQPVAGEAVAAAEPAQPAAERVADDADVGRGARERGQPGLGRGPRDVHPLRAGLDARHAVRLVDLDAAHLMRLDEDGVVERAERRGVVARRLHRDPQPVAAGEVHEHLDVGRAARDRDERGALVDGEVPRLAGVVPRLFTGQDDRAGDGGAQERDVGVERAG
jgi:hypothetical protein